MYQDTVILHLHDRKIPVYICGSTLREFHNLLSRVNTRFTKTPDMSLAKKDMLDLQTTEIWLDETSMTEKEIDHAFLLIEALRARSIKAVQGGASIGLEDSTRKCLMM